jgi:hypothetical protein
MKFNNLYKLNVKVGDIVYSPRFGAYATILLISDGFIDTNHGFACSKYSLFGNRMRYNFDKTLAAVECIISGTMPRIHEVL